MKSYTDLEQSKKLEKILSLKSADMCFANDGTATKIDANSYKTAIQLWSKYYVEIIPCWSLAALLDVFPNSEQKSVDICNGGWKGEEYVSDWFCSYYDYEKNYFETTHSDNPVDACVEMIIKLKENKLL